MQEKLTEYKTVATFLDDANFSEVIKHMRAWNSEQLAEFQLHYPHAIDHLKEPEFDDFWEAWRDKLRIPGSPDFRFMAQPGIKDVELVIGYVSFLLDLEAKDAKGGYPSIYSVRRQLHQIYTELNHATEEDLQRTAGFLYNLEAFAKLQQCPGYLALANGYMQLALRYQQMRLEEQSAAAFQLCWKFLHLAALSEPHSQEAINNAYFGRGLSLSNPFRLQSVIEMKSYCRKAADELLPLDAQTSAEKAAVIMYRHSNKLRDLAEDVRPSLGM
ncbi:Ankyrin repeat protein [Legionella shakespearei DSM 23087]|uniref:Ankyrin repeat protein n=2 Tax=Legionella shakespearei TaxID=45075 RepID=A0A0W0ZF59_9GAMM|nr:Ankyrin repeat protein [Legionella shakespearei DSM 23087]